MTIFESINALPEVIAFRSHCAASKTANERLTTFMADMPDSPVQVERAMGDFISDPNVGTYNALVLTVCRNDVALSIAYMIAERARASAESAFRQGGVEIVVALHDAFEKALPNLKALARKPEEVERLQQLRTSIDTAQSIAGKDIQTAFNGLQGALNFN